MDSVRTYGTWGRSRKRLRGPCRRSKMVSEWALISAPRHPDQSANCIDFDFPAPSFVLMTRFESNRIANRYMRIPRMMDPLHPFLNA